MEDTRNPPTIDESLEELRTEESKLEAEKALEAIRPTDEPGVVGRAVDWLTEEDIDDRIHDLRAKTAEQERKRERLLEDFRELVREEFGLELERPHIEALLYQVNGADLVDGIVVARVLTRVEAHIRDIIVEATGVPEPLDGLVSVFSVRAVRYRVGLSVPSRRLSERLSCLHAECESGLATIPLSGPTSCRPVRLPRYIRPTACRAHARWHPSSGGLQ